MKGFDLNHHFKEEALIESSNRLHEAHESRHKKRKKRTSLAEEMETRFSADRRRTREPLHQDCHLCNFHKAQQYEEEKRYFHEMEYMGVCYRKENLYLNSVMSSFSEYFDTLAYALLLVYVLQMTVTIESSTSGEWIFIILLVGLILIFLKIFLEVFVDKNKWPFLEKSFHFLIDVITYFSRISAFIVTKIGSDFFSKLDYGRNCKMNDLIVMLLLVILLVSLKRQSFR